MAKLNFKDFEEEEIVLIVTPSNLVQQINLEILKHFVNEKNSLCIYTTVAKPYQTVSNILKKNKIKIDNIFFIDCITSLTIGDEIERAGNVIFVSPKALTNLSIALTTALGKLPKDKNKLLILDTLSTLMLYNESKIVSRFMHSLSGKLRQWGVKSIVFTLEEEADKKIISEISQFCDKVIKV